MLKPYAEQTKTYDNGRGKIFTIRLFCQGTYDFTIKDYGGNTVHLITAIDVHYVHECVREMRGWHDNQGIEPTSMDSLPG